MVSLKRSVFGCVLMSFMAITFLVLLSVNGYAASCCKNGVLSTCAGLGGGLSYDLSGCMSGGLIDEDRYLCLEKEVAMSNCGFCRVGQKCFQTVDCSYKCQFSIIDGGELTPVFMAGSVQYQPEGVCGTKSQTCCSDSTWSGWGTSCPKTCTGLKPPEMQSCGSGGGGTKNRIVTCSSRTPLFTITVKRGIIG